ncbi:cupredoxin domain-containing protein [Cohnella cholangitidis]|uniref:Cytochrome C oxidase subunit II n=1 Tax=Cohnella cholangitidis TaxID=2598458 RepID=A0A7G5C2I2_9BACL|nr:cupredoxin domain-containing protein [Cohnella cholangitidis]QMV43416.1 cytochrome C oxidase subunit II [Cohnella cholangitidis]
MKKSGSLFAIFALATALTLSACANKNNANNNVSPSPSPSPTATTTATAPAAGGGGVQEVTIDASNWKFQPEDIKAKVGDTLKISLKNSQGVHGIESDDELGIKLKNGETQEVKLTKAGAYEFHCSVQCGQGHNDMTGTIVVE